MHTMQLCYLLLVLLLGVHIGASEGRLGTPLPSVLPTSTMELGSGAFEVLPTATMELGSGAFEVGSGLLPQSVENPSSARMAPSTTLTTVQPTHIMGMSAVITPTVTPEPTGPAPYLLFANRLLINRINLDGSGLEPVVNTTKFHGNAIALDFDVRNNYMFWTDVSAEMSAIFRAQLDGSQIEKLTDTGLSIPDGLAWDWVNGKLYWTDSNHQEIEVLDPVSGDRRSLISTGTTTIPRAIVVDPTTRWLYWTDWGDLAMIERASMDGLARRVIHNTGLVWPNALTLDYETQVLYWADANLDRIESSQADGTNRVVVTQRFIIHPFSITVSNGNLYWTDWAFDSVLSAPISSPDSIRLVVGRLDTEPMNIHVIARTRQPTATNPCSSAPCSHLCLLSAVAPSGYTCTCPDETSLSDNGNNCTTIVPTPVVIPSPTPQPGSCIAAGYRGCCTGGSCLGEPPTCFCNFFCFEFENCCHDVHQICSQAYLLFANRQSIYRSNLDGTELTAIVSDETNAVGIDFDYRQNYTYWTDVMDKVIKRARLDGSEVQTLIQDGLQIPDGIAVDWINNKLYWTDADSRHIEVYDLSNGNRKTLISTGQNTIPRALVVDPTTRWLYWSDWGTTGRIEKASMDGSVRTVIHNTSLIWPNGLTLDYQDQLLYWVDASLDKIESSTVDGLFRQIITRRGIFHPFAITTFQRKLFWSDWQVDSIFSRGIVLTVNTTIIIDGLATEPMGVQVVTMERQPQVLNPCGIDNGNCSYLCLLSAVAPEGYTCACPNGEVLTNLTVCEVLPPPPTSLLPSSPLPQPSPNVGSCIAAGYQDCCREGICEGRPATCFCDTFCFEFDDCCEDFFSICQPDIVLSSIPGDRTTAAVTVKSTPSLPTTLTKVVVQTSTPPPPPSSPAISSSATIAAQTTSPPPPPPPSSPAISSSATIAAQTTSPPPPSFPSSAAAISSSVSAATSTPLFTSISPSSALAPNIPVSTSFPTHHTSSSRASPPQTTGSGVVVSSTSTTTKLVVPPSTHDRMISTSGSRSRMSSQLTVTATGQPPVVLETPEERNLISVGVVVGSLIVLVMVIVIGGVSIAVGLALCAKKQALTASNKYETFENDVTLKGQELVIVNNGTSTA